MITVRYFASLREEMGLSSETLPELGIKTVEDVWNKVSQGRLEGRTLLCAVNHKYAKLDTPVQSNDEVAFFPPVTGG